MYAVAVPSQLNIKEDCDAATPSNMDNRTAAAAYLAAVLTPRHRRYTDENLTFRITCTALPGSMVMLTGR